MEEKYIKKDGRIYLQITEEIEINLKDLEDNLKFIDEEAQNKKEEIQKQINKIKSII